MTTAVLNSFGKEPSDKERLMRVVIGQVKTSTQDFRRREEIESREQVEFEDAKMACLISAVVTNSERDGGGTSEGECGAGVVEVKQADNLEILSSNFF